MKGRKRYNFGGEEGLDRFLREVKSVFDKLKTKEKIQFHEIVEQVAGGYTQTGKTAFKAALAILGKISGVATIVITTVVDNRRRLVHDLKENYFAGIELCNRPECLDISDTIDDEEKISHADRLKRCIVNHGVIVVNLTGGAIKKVRKVISELRDSGLIVPFSLVKDESDTMDRTPDDGQRLVLETELDRLMGKAKLDSCDGGLKFGSPLLILNVSATLVPVFLRIHRDGKTKIGVYAVKPEVEVYSGLDNMTPVFLGDKELQLRNEYWSRKVEELYRDAHPEREQDQREGILVLDAVNPRVNVDRSIMQRAEKVSRLFCRFVVVAIWGGGGIKVKLPGDSWMTKENGKLLGWCESTLSKRFDVDSSNGSDEDESIPANDPESGSSSISRKRGRATVKFTISQVLTAVLISQEIGRPIAVIGYSRLLRGDSFRTDPVVLGGEERSVVPTHVCNRTPLCCTLLMILYSARSTEGCLVQMSCGLSEVQAVENLVQMVGRATFNGKAILERNLGSGAKVRMLINFRDWDLARKYYAFQEELLERLKFKTMDEVLGDESEDSLVERFSWRADISDTGKRPIGAPRRNNQVSTQFEEPPEDALASNMLLGAAWAVEHGYPAYGPRGHKFSLASPISVSARLGRMNADDHVIEEYLYHSRHHSNLVAMLLRKAIMGMVSSWDEGPDGLQDDLIPVELCRSWCSELYALSFSDKDGCDVSVKQRSKRWSDVSACHTGAPKGQWRLAPCRWPLFTQEFEDSEVAGYRLNRKLSKFVRNFRAEILSKPPLHTKEQLELFLARELSDEVCA